MAIKCPYYFYLFILVQNASKLAYVHLSVQKILRGYIPNPSFKGAGGKAKGRVGLEGMEGREWELKKDEGEREEGEERDGG
jgi:hypothetical protein